MGKTLSSLGLAALDYARRGLYVFPLVPYDNKPLIRGYYQASSVDEAQIRTWWEAYPQANIGLDCGKSHIVAVDVDPKNGGDVPFRGLRSLTGGAPAWATLRHGTPSGGEHYLFLAPSDDEHGLTSRSMQFGVRGIDIKTRGGYIALPPSKRAAYGSEFYTVLDDVAPIELPTRLRFAPTTARDAAGRTDLEGRLQDQERIPLGAQDDFLYAVAGRLRRTGFEEVEIAALLAETYALRCEPAPSGTRPHGSEDFMRIARSAQRHAPSESLLEDAAVAAADGVPGDWDDADQSIAINAGVFLRNATDTTQWIVDGLLQRQSLNQLQGDPKAGKSTLLRHLAICVAYGLPFLGRFATIKSRVLVYSLQENKPHLRAWLTQQVGLLAENGVVVEDDIPIDFVFRLGRRGAPAVKGMLARCKRREYGLVLIDMFGRFAGLRSLDDYAEVETLCDALKDVVDQTGASLMWTHHERKAKGPDAFVGNLGSQAIRGAVYTTMRTSKENGRYFLATEQRDGDDLSETGIVLDKAHGTLRAVGSKLSFVVAAEGQLKGDLAELLRRDPRITATAAAKVLDADPTRCSDILKTIKAGDRAS